MSSDPPSPRGRETWEDADMVVQLRARSVDPRGCGLSAASNAPGHAAPSHDDAGPPASPQHQAPQPGLPEASMSFSGSSSAARCSSSSPPLLPGYDSVDASTVSACPQATQGPMHHSAPAAPDGAAPCATPACPPLLSLPDTLLVTLWDLLDRVSRAALYHSCTTFWKSRALNAQLKSLVIEHGDKLAQLLAWPRHAGLPQRLRLINSKPHPGDLAAAMGGGGGGATDEHDDTGPASHKSSVFVRFLQEAWQEPRAMELLSDLHTLALQGRGADRELCKRLGAQLGNLCMGLRSLQLDWVCMSGETCASIAAWLPHLAHLSLTCVNSQDVRGVWPSSVLTYADLGLLTSLKHLEIIDSHLPFLELGVADISGLRSLSQLETLALVFSEREHAWPGSKPCYLLLGLEEVAVACEGLRELVLDGVQLAKLSHPSWPSLTTLCLGFISGWHPALLTALKLDTAAPRLKRMSLGPIKCSAESPDARALYARRLLQASRSLAACACPPRHLELSAPPTFMSLAGGTPAPPGQLLVSLAPLGPHVTSLSLDIEGLGDGDAAALAAALPNLRRLTLHVSGRQCGRALSELLDALPALQYLQLGNGSGKLVAAQSAFEPVPDGNVLAVLYAAWGGRREGPLTLHLRSLSAFVMSCLAELRQLPPLSGHGIEIVAHPC